MKGPANSSNSFPFVRLWIPIVCTIVCHTRTATCDSVTSLTGKTFEHHTQASSGQTTGTWFILFSANDRFPAECIKCKEAEAQWRRVAAKEFQKSSLQFAQVIADDTSGSAKLLKRFGVKYLPHYILFRDRKMFHLPSSDQNESDLVAFAHDRYRGVNAERVPPPPSLFDDTREYISDFTNENLAKVGTAMVILISAIFIICLLLRRQKEKHI